MSESRIPDQTISVRLPRKQGKIQHSFIPKIRVELFGAYQFRTNHNRLKRNFYPRPPSRTEERRQWYQTMFRLRLDGRWYGERKYTFLDRAAIAGLLLDAEQLTQIRGRK